MMKFSRLLLGSVLGVCASSGPLAAQPAAPTPPAAAPAPAANPVEPGALEALRRMSAYIGSFTTFKLTADTTLDVVLDNGQKVQVSGETTYDVRRPNGFVIQVASDLKIRRFYYDGKSLTVYDPEANVYATTAAPATIRQTLDMAYQKYGIDVPLQDLFTWADPNDGRAKSLLQGFYVGATMVGGVDCDQYAFQQGDVDWQIWISHSDEPLPMKMLVVSRNRPSHPQFESTLHWVKNLAYDDATFALHPTAGAVAIDIVQVGK
jgi:hypothetical protein